MSSLSHPTYDFKSFCKIDFSGGDLSSNCGLLLVADFMKTMGLTSFVEENFGNRNTRRCKHSDSDILLQLLYQNIAGYSTDDAADHLANEPMLKTLLHKDRLASQPTLSRFRSRLDYERQAELELMIKFMRKQAYAHKVPKNVILDIDTTILCTYGKQEGGEYIHHYDAVGYHPMLCYDGNTRDLLKVELRDGNMYCGNGAAQFMRPLLQEYKHDYPDVNIMVRGDSGFAMPDLYECVERFDKVEYVIRLKKNKVLMSLVKEKVDELSHEYAISSTLPKPVYGEFSYQAESWNKARRVIYKIEPIESEGAAELFPICTFIVTNSSDKPEDIVELYCQRGNMENFIKESKNEFNFQSTCSREKLNNENRLLIAAIAYNIFNFFRRFCLPEMWQKFQAGELRRRLMYIAGRCVFHSKEIRFKLCSTYLYKEQFAHVYSQLARMKKRW